MYEIFLEIVFENLLQEKVQGTIIEFGEYQFSFTQKNY